jgi:hypothetical protein
MPLRCEQRCNTRLFLLTRILLYKMKADATYCCRLKKTSLTLSMEVQEKSTIRCLTAIKIHWATVQLHVCVRINTVIFSFIPAG